MPPLTPPTAMTGIANQSQHSLHWIQKGLQNPYQLSAGWAHHQVILGAFSRWHTICHSCAKKQTLRTQTAIDFVSLACEGLRFLSKTRNQRGLKQRGILSKNESCVSGLSIPGLCIVYLFNQGVYIEYLLYYLAWATITKYHRLGSLNNRNLFCHSFGGWKSKIRVPAWSVSGEVSLPGLQMATLSLCPYMAKRDSSSLVFLFIKAIIPPIMGAPPSWLLLILLTSQRPHLQILSHWGLGL